MGLLYSREGFRLDPPNGFFFAGKTIDLKVPAGRGSVNEKGIDL